MGELSAQQLQLIERFVLRARIVQDHSLARDYRELKDMAKTQFKIKFVLNPATGERTASMSPVDLIPTEQLESAAARVRPIFLKKDKVHYDSVLDAVSAVLKGRSEAKALLAKVRELRSCFRQADPTTLRASRNRVGPEAPCQTSNCPALGCTGTCFMRTQYVVRTAVKCLWRACIFPPCGQYVPNCSLQWKLFI